MLVEAPIQISNQEVIFKNAAKTFTPEFEINRALNIDRSSNEQRENFLSYEIMQMETHLGERLNVNISRFEYEIRAGHLFGKDMSEPFIESIKKGRDIRRETGNSVDFVREDAEVEGFLKIEDTLLNSETPIGTMMLSISPKGADGSTYQHNFYDVFTLCEKDGKRFIETRRYTSGLNAEDYEDVLRPFADIKVDKKDAAASFLANPIAIQNTLTPDDLHFYLHKNHNSMEEASFSMIKKQCEGIAKEFAKSLLDEPFNTEKHKKLFNTYLNKADSLVDEIKSYGVKVVEQNFIETKVYHDVLIFGGAPVRQVMTGCGASGGFETNSTNGGFDSPFSVADFYGKDKYGERTFNCPSCKKENVRPYNTLIPRCQHCKSTKVACDD